MSRIDENGVQHPTDDDPISHNAEVHLIYCRECNPYALPLPEVVAQALEDAADDIREADPASPYRWLRARAATIKEES